MKSEMLVELKGYSLLHTGPQIQSTSQGGNSIRGCRFWGKPNVL